MKIQKMIIETDIQKFHEIVNTHLSNGWIATPNSFQMLGVSDGNIFQFRYGIVLEKNEI